MDEASVHRRYAPDILTVEVADDETFLRVIAHAKTPVSSASDWTARVLIGGLKPARTYWYRFTDTDGNGSRVGRTITAPLPNDPRTVNFAFVSCQDINEGKLNAFRRMIYDDERAPAAEQLDFVLQVRADRFELHWRLTRQSQRHGSL